MAMLLRLLLSGDVELNPGPDPARLGEYSSAYAVNLGGAGTESYLLSKMHNDHTVRFTR